MMRLLPIRTKRLLSFPNWVDLIFSNCTSWCVKILDRFLELYPQTMKSDKKSYTCKKISFLDTHYKITAFLNGQAYCK